MVAEKIDSIKHVLPKNLFTAKQDLASCEKLLDHRLLPFINYEVFVPQNVTDNGDT